MKKRITAFYLETLLLAAVFVGVVLVLTGVFARARADSARAQRLTHAVMLAENAAEAMAASDSVQTLAALLEPEGEIRQRERGVAVSQGDYRVEVLWTPAGEVAEGHITVLFCEEEVYTLDTAVYIGEAAA